MSHVWSRADRQAGLTGKPEHLGVEDETAKYNSMTATEIPTFLAGNKLYDWYTHMHRIGCLLYTSDAADE